MKVLAGILLIVVIALYAPPCAEASVPSSSPLSSLELELGDEAANEIFWYRVDTSSPRMVLLSFVRVMRIYQQSVQKTGYTWTNAEQTKNLSAQIDKLFDLRTVPEDFRNHVAMEGAVHIREILARVVLPKLKLIPDEDEMAARIAIGKAPIYRVPGTPIEIGLSDTGRYQFRPSTLAQARSLYGEVKHLPYAPKQQYVNGLYQSYFFYSGPLLPHELMLALPNWFYSEFYEQTVWQWCFVALAVLSLVLLRVLRSAISKHTSESSLLVRRTFELFNPLSGLILAYFLEVFLRDHVFLTGDVLQSAVFVTRALTLFYLVVGIINLGNLSSELILSTERYTGSTMNQQLVRLAGRLLSLAFAVVVVIEGMQRIGFSLATLVAGAGVGGLAIALAAQNTFKNIISGIELSLDKPFVEGQRIKVDDMDGIVEDVGLRSTRLRTLTGHQITIPNEVAANAKVENVGRRPYIRRTFHITVTYDTSPAKVARAVELIQQILALPDNFDQQNDHQHPNVPINQPDLPPRVFFNEFNADSLNIAVNYWYHPPEYWDYSAHAQWVNMQIMERFAAEKIEFAFPTQTLYLAGDNERPLDIGMTERHAPTAREKAVRPVRATPISDEMAPDGKTMAEVEQAISDSNQVEVDEEQEPDSKRKIDDEDN
ncbi:hypothetical protein GCM10011369_06140 [Neiella marina]|uniref:Small-conductance mechanosensitive channel n=1 Tax=Neiella marina TaxID=508461 RepID=A0A8J2U2V5_9GAMM|nr:mechanosensitive ion channel family protein [Neiella marina]GGA67252.1 hypothetical protein GCM10011369_06140 [Neiella marina]